ncbi:MAG: pantetheine-phosphate adenylyltransferase [Bacilli bacterium]|jgi:pantetheine-phosphate adenylyltransferase|nr:pantetheine-phosphate adenylyltransferase [Bacilli bacterium]
MRIACYPGSFDPLTNGHIDVALRALKMFDKLIIIVAENYEKNYAFSLDERLSIVRKAFKDYPNIEVIKGEGLTAKQAKAIGAQAIIRGLRMASDYDYEYQYAQINEYLEPDVDMVFLMARKEYSFISSTRIKEIFSLGGDIAHLVPPFVLEAMEKKAKKTK